MNVLLVEPNFPYPSKSKHRANEVYKNFIPIGLLKIGAWHKSIGDKVRLVRGKDDQKNKGYLPDKILITSLFTYWSKYVWDTVEFYRLLYPNSEIILGGIYVTLHNKTKKFQELAKKFKIKYHIGLHKNAEEFYPDYSLLDNNPNYHLIHSMRGCIRKCSFCGVWKVEPKLTFKEPEKIIKEIITIGKNNVIFLDNNLLANPYKTEILNQLSHIRINGRPVIFESQSGFDGRLLEKEKNIALLLKKARFQNIRIAWDHGLKDAKLIYKQISYFVDVGYLSKDLSVFMVYNFDIPYEEMINKIKYCKKWNVQIADCRFRPLTSLKDDFKPGLWRKGQTKEDYYIHNKSGWSDKKIRLFRKAVRQHNIEVRYGFPYNKQMEQWSAIHGLYKFFNLGRPPKMEAIIKSSLLQKNIQKMKKIRSILIKEKKGPIDLSGFKKNKFINKLNSLIEPTN